MKIFLAAFLIMFCWTNLSAQQKFEIAFNMGYDGGSKPSFTEFQDTDALPLEKAREIFKEIKEKSGIEFRYSYGGCEDRAHAIALLLKGKEIKTRKIWNFNAYSISLFNKFHSPSIPDGTGLNPRVYWGFHVAVIVPVKDKEKVQMMVLDPAVSKDITTIDEWLKAQESPNSYYTFTDAEWFSFYTIEGRDYMSAGKIPSKFPNLLTGDFIKNEGVNFNQQWVEEGLAINEVGMKITEEVITKESQVSAKSFYFRNLVTNVINLTDMLTRNDIPDEALTYSADIEKYRALFIQRKSIWKERLDIARNKP